MPDLMATDRDLRRALNLPPASSRPPGSITLGTSADERDEIRDGIVLIGVGTLFLGFLSGYLLGRRRRAHNVPARTRRK